MSKTFRPYDPEQAFLMPASLQDWLPKGHLAYFISDVVDHPGSECHYEPLRGRERLSTVPSCYDGQGAAICLLHWGAIIPQDREAA